jgi:hypothetical protein
MSSPLEAHDGIDRTVTPSDDIPIRRQKRTFTMDVISDVWVEGQREILLKLKDGTRVVSPRTLDVIDDMLNQCNTALSEDFKTEYFEEIVEGLQKSIPFLEARLETDDKYAEELASFTALGHENILLKYGDSCAEACNTIRSMAVGDDKARLQGRKWKDVVWELDAEEEALKEWEADGKQGAMPNKPIKNLIFNISLLWKDFTQKEMTAMMKFYADRNGLAHSGLDEFIKDHKWSKLANLLRRDYNNVNTYYPLPKDKDKADLLRKVILSCQKKFFDWIVDEWDEGDVSAGSYKVKDDIMAKDIKIQAAKQKALEEEENAAELQKLILASTDEEPLTKAQMEELEAAQKDYQALVGAEKEYVEKVKKRNVEEVVKETARKEAAKAKILEAKAQLEKARPKKSNS